MPSDIYFKSAQSVFVNAIGVGKSIEPSDTYNPIKVSVGEITVSLTGQATIEFYTSDDASVNDGSSMFEISNADDMAWNLHPGSINISF